ncbi:MAG: glycosyltransferase family 4 protein [Candidatus Parvarchaeota archaeon]
MKVVIYANSFLPDTGGGEKYNYDLARNLSLAGDDVTVITPVKCYVKDNYNFKVIRICGRQIFSFIKVFQQIRKIKPDLVHISGPTEIDYFLFPMIKVLNLPVILTYHADFPSIMGRVYNNFIGIFQHFFNYVMVQSKNDKQKLTERGVSAEKILNFPFNGIDPEKYRIIEPHRIRDIDLIFVGRMDKAHNYKGYWELLEILTKMADETSCTLSVYIVGGGSDLPKFRYEATARKLNISVFEDVTDEQLVEFLNRSKFLILPSISTSEGFGRTVLEAIYCGAIPIVSRFAGSHELVKELNCGIIIDPRDINKTSKEICSFLQDNDAILEKRKNVYEIIAKKLFSISWTVNMTREVYYKVLKQR